MREKKVYRYGVHLAVWMTLVTLYALPTLKANWGSALGMTFVLVRYILYGFINFQLFYLLVFYVFGRHRPGAAIARSIVAAAATVLAFCLIKYGVGLYFKDVVLQKAFAMIGKPRTYLSFFQYFRLTLGTGLGVAAAACAYHIFLRWRTSDRESRALEQDAAAAARQYERMRFSSLLLMRKLQALEGVLQDERKRDREGAAAILQLSELLRYMLYDKNARQEKAPLEKELYYFDIYLRLHNQLFPRRQVTLEISGPLDGRYLAPLQLQTAAESLLEQQAGESPVTLRLEVSGDTLSLSAPEIRRARKPLWHLLQRYKPVYCFKTPLYAGPR
ncbi:hypothetical protein ACWKWU_22215 [Chitinophaga lutea]